MQLLFLLVLPTVSQAFSVFHTPRIAPNHAPISLVRRDMVRNFGGPGFRKQPPPPPPPPPTPEPLEQPPQQFEVVETQETPRVGKDLPSLSDLTNMFKKQANLDTVLKNKNEIRENIVSGEAGSRGELFFLTQFSVLGCVAFGGLPIVGDLLMFLLGPGLSLLGLITIVLAIQDLGPSLSPWPVVSTRTQLVTTGTYGQVRHPIYAGLIALSVGFSILTGDANRLLITALLQFVLQQQTAFEEQDLVENFPVEYPAYQEEVTGKFFPEALLDEMPWKKKKGDVV